MQQETFCPRLGRPPETRTPTSKTPTHKVSLCVSPKSVFVQETRSLIRVLNSSGYSGRRGLPKYWLAECIPSAARTSEWVIAMKPGSQRARFDLLGVDKTRATRGT